MKVTTASPNRRRYLVPRSCRYTGGAEAVCRVGPVRRCSPGSDAIPMRRAVARRTCSQTGCMLICMHSTSVRIDAATHEELKRLAAELHTTVGNAVTLAVRALRQDVVGTELATPPRDDEVSWLDAELR